MPNRRMKIRSRNRQVAARKRLMTSETEGKKRSMKAPRSK